MKILIVPEIAARESSFVRPGEIQVVGYKEHLEDISRLLDAQDKILTYVLAYDEAKEREMARFYYDADISKTSSWHDFLCGWMACAKSRARSAEQ